MLFLFLLLLLFLLYVIITMHIIYIYMCVCVLSNINLNHMRPKLRYQSLDPLQDDLNLASQQSQSVLGLTVRFRVRVKQTYPLVN